MGRKSIFLARGGLLGAGLPFLASTAAANLASEVMSNVRSMPGKKSGGCGN